MEGAEPGEDLALVADDAETRAEIRHVAVDRLVGAEFADIAERLLAARHVETAGSVEVVPLRLVFAVAVEDLDAVVLAVGDVDPAIRVAADIVDDVELAGIGAGLAPRHNKLAVRRIFMHARIAVAVRDVDLVLRR